MLRVGNIYLYSYHKNQPNVGKYTSPMDGMGSNGAKALKFGKAILISDSSLPTLKDSVILLPNTKNVLYYFEENIHENPD